MERAGKILGGALRRLKKPEAALAWLSAAWPSVVGRALAAHTRPVRCSDGRLEVAADSKVWQKQLESMKSEFCARVNQAWGGELVQEVKFLTKPGPRRLSREADNDYLPFIRRRR